VSRNITRAKEMFAVCRLSEPEGPVTGHHNTDFPPPSSKCWSGFKVPSCFCSCTSLMHPARFKTTL